MHNPDSQTPPVPVEHVAVSTLDFPVVGIGASAGGIEALKLFFEHMPSDSGMAFVVILHLSPKHESNVDKIIERVTNMAVTQVETAVSIKKDHIYVISPALQLEMSDGKLLVRPAQRPPERHIAIDLFFRTLAEAHQERAFAIILSGTGADGTAGLGRVKEWGGLTFAQHPEDALFDGMPRSAIRSNAVDFVVPVIQMPQKILDLWAKAHRIEIPALDDMPEPAHPPSSRESALAAEAALAELLRLLLHRSGHDFRHYKRATILRRIERRMQVTGVSDIPSYLSFFEENPEETEGLIGDLLIGVTNFFRDREAFEALESEIVPRILNGELSIDQNEGIRIWTAACSTGEEAYSVAMMLTAEAAKLNMSPKIQVFASDVDERSIAFARRGLYPVSVLADIPSSYLRQFLAIEKSHYRVAKQIRDRILFAPHNILGDPPFSRLHLITCRNFLIYLDRHAQREVLQTFHSALRPGGYLFLGSSETADAADKLFTAVDKKNRIYRANTAVRTGSRSLPVVRAANPLLRGPALNPVELPAEPRHTSYTAIHQQSLEKHGPPSVLVDPAFQILHTSGSAGQFLRHMDGEPSYNLLSLIDPKLRVETRTALLQAFRTGSPVRTRILSIVKDGAPVQRMTIAVWPVNKQEHERPLALLMFDELGPQEEMAISSTVFDASRDAALETLEAEVQSLTEQLSDTMVQSNASTESLRASNEELQAINEELRSATEELETSKEELQSINEELITVNYELKTKVDETAKINDDLHNLISSSDIATIVVDHVLRIKWFTPKTTELFNLLPADNGRSLSDITHRLEYPDMMNDAAKAFEALRLVEKEIPSSDGRWYLARMLPYRTVEDHISGAILNFVDITSRRLAEQRLREGLDRLRMVAESTTQFAIITMDPFGRITGWNRAAELIFGYAADEVEGRTFEFIFTSEDRLNGEPARELQKARDQGHADDERWHVRKDGSRFYCSGVVHPLVDGKLRGYAKIARDMTDKRIGQAEQEAHFEQTHASSLLKDQFIAIMSHELRHPLNLIQLNADLLAGTLGIDRLRGARKAIEAIRRSVHSQSQIIEDLLDISRAKMGKLKLNPVPLKIAAALSDIVEVVSTQAQDAEVTLRAESLGDPDNQGLVIVGDTTRVEQIAWNLLSNAIKFTPQGGSVTITLSQDHGYARLEIRDTGIGIVKSALGSIFEMFKQIDRPYAKKQSNGLGIGLALVAQLVQAHGGRVQAESQGEGKGAQFTVWLPLASNTHATSVDAVAPSTQPLGGMRVLLVDDSPDILDILGTLCEMRGAQVTTAASGKAALDLLRQEDYDVLVSDIGMPDMDGYALLTALRQGGRNANLPAIALSGLAHDSKAALVGFADQLMKPVPIKELIAKLNEVAGQRLQ